MTATDPVPPASDFASFEIVVTPDRDRVVVAAHGELDIATADPLEQEVRALVTRGFTSVELDLRGLTFIDSSGLRLLLRLDAAARSDGFTLTIRDGEGPVRRLLKLTHLDERLTRRAPR